MRRKEEKLLLNHPAIAHYAHKPPVEKYKFQIVMLWWIMPSDKCSTMEKVFSSFLIISLDFISSRTLWSIIYKSITLIKLSHLMSFPAIVCNQISYSLLAQPVERSQPMQPYLD